jgi:EAL domain-containing protein (putative c-di-GMP-specific phosphodiesterase class I)/FixJ family two-component response regulator
MNAITEIRVIVFDDDPFMLGLVERVLAQLGIAQITTCDTPDLALRAMDHPRGPPDLILLDLNMPEMDGIEFLRHLVKRRYAGALILVSGEEESILQSVERLLRAHKLTSLGHLQKPFAREALAALIATWKPAMGDRREAKRTAFGRDAVRAALDNDEFVNYYQPVVSVATGNLVGVEALVRWRHPTAGLVFPDQFIGVAEADGLISELTLRVLAAALGQARSWKDAGLALTMAVNISTRDLASLDFPNTAFTCAAAAGVSPQSVVLEVTESRLLGQSDIALDVLNRLRLKRFRLSIDDFGTGHSSLAQLRDVPFDQLKVDRTFVHGAAVDATVRAIYGASLALGQSLHIEVVAEGVEDRADWDFVRRTRCDVAQGYFVARPMPAEELPDWLATWQTRLATESLLIG